MWPPPEIDRYDLDPNPIGEGGFSYVHKATDSRFPNSKLVVKILKPPWDLWPRRWAENHEELSGEWEQTRATFAAESQLMRQIRGPGIATVYDTGTVVHPDCGEVPFLVSDYATAGTLRDRLDQLNRAITISEAIELINALERILTSLGQPRPDYPQGVVHRDIKPSNLLIHHQPGHRRTPTGELFGVDEELVVTDFGLAKAIDPENDNFTGTRGTDLYCAPEQWDHDASADTTADTFAATVVLVEALTHTSPRHRWLEGQPIFDDQTLTQTGAFEPAIRTALSTERVQRLETVSEWARSLRQTLDTPSFTSTNVPPIQRPEPTPKPSQVRQRTMAAVAVAAVLAAFIGFRILASTDEASGAGPDGSAASPDTDQNTDDTQTGDEENDTPGEETNPATPDGPETENNLEGQPQNDDGQPGTTEPADDPASGNGTDEQGNDTQPPATPTPAIPPPIPNTCVLAKQFSFTGGPDNNGNGDGENVQCPTARLSSNGNETGDRFTIRFEDCDFEGTLTATGTDGTTVITNSDCKPNAAKTFPIPAVGELGLTLTLTDPNGTYRVVSNATG